MIHHIVIVYQNIISKLIAQTIINSF